jgi:hypothetical protein
MYEGSIHFFGAASRNKAKGQGAGPKRNRGSPWVGRSRPKKGQDQILVFRFKKKLPVPLPRNAPKNRENNRKTDINFWSIVKLFDMEYGMFNGEWSFRTPLAIAITPK